MTEKEIEVGEYIINQNRLIIGQIVEINEERQEAIIKIDKAKIPIGFWNIKKHSKNIIDLIEVGDIVNEDLIVYKGRVANGEEKLLAGNHTINGMALEVVNVKTVLTKEQHMQNCYRFKKVEEER